MKDDAEERLSEAYSSGDTRDCHDFNLSVMVFLPKKSSGTDPDAGDYFSPENTRPLSIVNTDNRIIANAYRFRWEPLLAQWISPEQRPGKRNKLCVLGL